MAIVNYESPVRHLTGELSKGGMVCRRKMYRNERGGVVREGRPEVYIVRKPRDYKKNPPRGAEQAHLQLFGEAARRTTALLRALDPASSPTAEQLAELEAYRSRFLSQLTHAADPNAPLDRTGTPKRYSRFDNFVRAMIYQSLRSSVS